MAERLIMTIKKCPYCDVYYNNNSIHNCEILRVKINKCFFCKRFYNNKTKHRCVIARNVFMYLSYLDRLNLENVSKNWRCLSTTEAWVDVEEIFGGNFISFNKKNFGQLKPPQEVIEKVITLSGQYLKVLILNDYIQSSILKKIPRVCQGLKYMELGLDVYKKADFKEFFQNMPNLYTLKITTPCSIQNLEGVGSNISIFYYNIGRYNHPATPNWCNNFCSMILKFELLTSLTLREIKLKESIYTCITNIQTLQHLGLIYCQLPKNYTDIKNLVRLESLDLEYITNMQNNFLNVISKHLKSLICLSIKNIKPHTHEKLDLTCVANLKFIENFNTCNMNNIDNSIFCLLNNLKKLECCGCLSVNDNAMFEVLKNCPNLEELNVMETNITTLSVIYADVKTRTRRADAAKLLMYAEHYIINNFQELCKTTNKFLILQHDLFWREQIIDI